MLDRVVSRGARYIKLGEGGKWEGLCFEEGTLRLAFYEASHELALGGERSGLMAAFPGRSKSTQASFAGQVLAFYQEPDDTVWITFAHGHLYWCQASLGVEFFGQDKTQFPNGSRLRRTIAGWRRCDVKGRALRISELGGEVTSVSQFRGTICRIQNLENLLSILNGDEDSQISIARTKRAEAVESLAPLIARFTPRDLELLVELMFSQSGWRRVGETGGTQKTVDLELEMPMTGERAFVQVKSRTTQKEFENYATQKDGRGDHRLFYVHHTSPTPLRNTRKDITVIDRTVLSERAFSSGLFDWIVLRSR